MFLFIKRMNTLILPMNEILVLSLSRKGDVFVFYSWGDALCCCLLPFQGL